MIDDNRGDSDSVTSFHDLPDTAWSEPATETASPAAETTNSEPAAETSPEAATAPPADQSASVAAPTLPGPIPFDRHKEILDAAYKERDDYKTRAERAAWADELTQAGYTADAIREALSVRNSVDADPVGYTERLIAAMREHPQYASQLRSMAARVLGQRAEQADPEPQPDFEDPRTGAKFYSNEQLAKRETWRERQLEARFDQKLRPMVEANEAAQAERERAVAVSQAQDEAKSEFDQFKDRPHFAEHKADIIAFMKERNYATGSLRDAYAHVLETKVIPKLTETGKAQAVADFQKQAAASSVKPSGPTSVPPKSPTSFYDKSLDWGDRK